MSEVWKLQRPLFTSGGGAADILAYTRARPRDHLLPQTPELLAAFGRDYKIYAEASMDKGKLTIHRVLRGRTLPPW